MSFYRSLSQNKDDFETFLENLELDFDNMAEKNPFMLVFLVIFTQNLNLGVLMTALNLKVVKLTF